MSETKEEAWVRIEAELSGSPLNSWMNVAPVSVNSDRQEVIVRMPFRRELSFSADLNIFHGGAVATLADIAGYAAMAVWHPHSTPTVSLAIEYLAPAIGDEIIARAQVRKRGRTLGRADIEMSIGGKLVALGRGTFSTS
jgi:uncharacterized protein (TIGR00369 family)